MSQVINLWFIPILHTVCYTQFGGDSMDFHLINVKTGEIEKEVALTVDDEKLKGIGIKPKAEKPE